uniref:Glutathione S-transferase UstS-like C-terminal domain-containing protein n=1 Tax=Bionectria ochroleuca TaxID=29856 RepID=A0A0B7K9K0_BIOOC
MEMDFYDIAMRAPSAEHCCSVNPWKSRLALNFKNIPHTTKWEEYASFNTHVDAAFSTYAGLMGYTMPVDSEATRDEFVRRAGAKSWDDFEVKGEAREQMIEAFKAMLGDLAREFTKNAGGPFILGARATYADLIVGGWLYMASRTLVDGEWQQVRSWHGGVFGDLFDGLKKYAEVK